MCRRVALTPPLCPFADIRIRLPPYPFLFAFHPPRAAKLMLKPTKGAHRSPGNSAPCSLHERAGHQLTGSTLVT